MNTDDPKQSIPDPEDDPLPGLPPAAHGGGDPWKGSADFSAKTDPRLSWEEEMEKNFQRFESIQAAWDLTPDEERTPEASKAAAKALVSPAVVECVDRVKAELPALYEAAFEQWWSIVEVKYEQQCGYLRGRATVKGIEGLTSEQQKLVLMARRGELETHLEWAQEIFPQYVRDFRAEKRQNARFRVFLRRAKDAYDDEQDRPGPPQTDTWFLALHWWHCGFWLMSADSIANSLRFLGPFLGREACGVVSIRGIISDLKLPRCSVLGEGVFREAPLLRIELDGQGFFAGRFAEAEK